MSEVVLRTVAGPGSSFTPRVYRGAVIGLGGIARQSHLPAFLADPGVSSRLQIVATVDDGPGVTPVGSITHFVHRSELAAMGPIDFVDICTPTASHLELTLWALEQGYHVLCEKPVAITRKEALRIADAARSAGRVVMPCHQHRYNPVWRRIHEWLAEDAIGRWYLAEMHVDRIVADHGSGAATVPWRGLAEFSRGGVLLDHGTHLIYQMLDMAGMPVGVRAWMGRLSHADYDVEDSAQLLFEYPGRLGMIFLTWGARRRENRVRIIGEHGSIEWVGGMLRLERDGEITSFDHSAELDKASYSGWFARLFADFADAMTRRESSAHPHDIEDVAAVLEAAYDSARTGNRVCSELPAASVARATEPLRS